MPEVGVPLEIGRGRILREGTSIAILSLGGRLKEVFKAADELATYGLTTTIADARFAKPLDHDLIRRLVSEHEVLLTIEEGAIGGFGSHVLQFLATEGLLDKGVKVRPMCLPDVFIPHGSPDEMYEDAGLLSKNIVETALEALGRRSARLGKKDAVGS